MSILSSDFDELDVVKMSTFQILRLWRVVQYINWIFLIWPLWEVDEFSSHFFSLLSLWRVNLKSSRSKACPLSMSFLSESFSFTSPFYASVGVVTQLLSYISCRSVVFLLYVPDYPTTTKRCTSIYDVQSAVYHTMLTPWTTMRGSLSSRYPLKNQEGCQLLLAAPR